MKRQKIHIIVIFKRKILKNDITAFKTKYEIRRRS